MPIVDRSTTVQYTFYMSGEVRDFLTAERPTISGMSLEDLASEVEGHRLVASMLPREVYEWLARMHETVRITRRNWTGSVGVLLGVKFEPVEYTVGVMERGFDALRGRQIIEDKIVTLPASAVMLFETIGEVTEYDPQAEDDALAPQSLDVGVGDTNG